MKHREQGFLGPDKIDQEGEVFDYIRELHGYLWEFTRHFKPWAMGSLNAHLDDAIQAARHNKEVQRVEHDE